MHRNDRIVLLWVSAMILLLFTAVGFMVGSKHCAKESTYFVFQNVISIAYLLLGLTVIVPLREHLSVVSILLLIGNGVLSLGQLYFLPYRTYHQLLMIAFTLSILHLAYCLLRFYISRKQHGQPEKKQLANGILPIVYVGGSFLIKGFGLFKLIETELNVPIALTGISFGLSVVAVILGAVFIKDRWNKKEFVGKLCAIFFVVFFAVFGIPLLTMEYANYAFDTSFAEKKECVVADKETTHGYKSGTSYRLMIWVDGRELRIDVDKVLYSQYEKGDTIYLYAYEGALGYPYYEYQLTSIYRYE